MQFFKKNKILLLFFVSIITSCSSNSFFEVYQNHELMKEIVVTTDRVICDCLDLEDDLHQKDKSKDGRYLFYLYVLDEEKTVLSVGRDNIWDRKQCQTFKTRLNKILTSSKKIFIGGRGSFDEPRKIKKDQLHNFPGHGIYPENSRVVNLSLLKGDNGQCMAMLDKIDTCTTSGFPLDRMPF